MSTIHAFAALKAGGPLMPFEYEAGPLAKDEVEIEVSWCGICHSDLSMIDNDWGLSNYPLVPGHEVVGKIVAKGSGVSHLSEGQVVGLGWYSESCMICPQCMGGDHNLCKTGEQTIVGRHGGFADRVRCHAAWAIPLPDSLDAVSAGPLFCGGITVFHPIVQHDVRPTDHVGVVGIGGLGHLALQFLSRWGCHVTAFTSSASKAEEARRFGAHEVIDSRDEEALAGVANSLDFLLSTVNAPLNWDLYINALKPKGRLHLVGAVLEPIPVAAFSLIGNQRSISGSPLGSPATIQKMLEFCERHNIAPMIETFPMSEVNEALDHLRAGKARYRIVLEADKATTS